MRTYLFKLVTLLVVGGCDKGPTATPPTTTPATQAAAKPAQHGDIEVFCQNLRPDGSEKNSVTFAGGGAVGATFAGDGGATELAWRFVEHRDGTDVYEISRRPKASPSTPSEVKSVQFTGKPITVFEDVSQRISLRPKRGA